MPIEVERSTDKDDKKTVEEGFLNELKSQFDKEIELRKNLDTKANTMITVASDVSTLLIAIGAFFMALLFRFSSQVK